MPGLRSPVCPVEVDDAQLAPAGLDEDAAQSATLLVGRLRVAAMLPNRIHAVMAALQARSAQVILRQWRKLVICTHPSRPAQPSRGESTGSSHAGGIPENVRWLPGA